MWKFIQIFVRLMTVEKILILCATIIELAFYGGTPLSKNKGV